MRIDVIGESCTDEFIYGKITRINPEAPTPIFVKNRMVKSNIGMAGNTYLNIKALAPNCEVNLICPIGVTFVKTRYVDKNSNYIVLRVDDEPVLNEEKQFNFENYIRSIANKLPDAIVISDYCKGFLTEEQIAKLAQWCRKNKIITFLDTKKKINNEWTFYIDYIKINETEFNASQHEKGICGGFIKKTSKTTLITTLGSKGCRIVAQDGQYVNIKVPTNPVEVRDVCGAGDSFLAALAVSVSENRFGAGRLYDCCVYANKVAGYACTKAGVVVVSNQDIDTLYEHFK